MLFCNYDGTSLLLQENQYLQFWRVRKCLAVRKLHLQLTVLLHGFHSTLKLQLSSLLSFWIYHKICTQVWIHQMYSVPDLFSENEGIIAIWINVGRRFQTLRNGSEVFVAGTVSLHVSGKAEQIFAYLEPPDRKVSRDLFTDITLLHESESNGLTLASLSTQGPTWSTHSRWAATTTLAMKKFW